MRGFAGERPVANLVPAGSSLKLCLLAEGRADLYPRLGRTMEWDIAAGSLIAARAGAAVSDRHGVELRFNSPGAKTAGIFTAPLAVHSEILTNFKA
jgi:3'(2'), 5'-bisphosphate nucleotidase